MPHPAPSRCRHTHLTLATAPNQCFQGPTAEAILAATQRTARAPSTAKAGPGISQPPPPHPLLPPVVTGTFPATLVLSGDALDVDDPEDAEEPQDVRSWRGEPERNRLSPKARRVLYVIPPPDVEGPVPGWVAAKRGGDEQAVKGKKGKGKGRGPAVSDESESPSAEEVARYLAAFYWPLEVRVWDGGGSSAGGATFVPWRGDEDADREVDGRDAIGLRFGDKCYRVRHREAPDGAVEGQLNLNDLLDGVVGMLPGDAYAACLLVRQDMYEDEDDDFCCGRAYGGSRIACVSFARYRPGLYVETPGEERHWWPGSYCAAFIGEVCDTREGVEGARADGTATRAALDAVDAVVQDRAALWLSRVCKTTAHELGHCFGVGHCAYAACLMQATAGLDEDERQPPYLCPVDLMKLAWAMDEAAVVDMGLGDRSAKARGTRAVRGGASMEGRMDVKNWLSRRYKALREVCGTRIGVDRMSTAFDAWLVCRLAEMDAWETASGGIALAQQLPSEQRAKRSAETRHTPYRGRHVVELSSDNE